MVANIFEFRLLTPRGSMLDTSVHLAVIPGMEGYFGVLAAHISMVSLTRPGLLELNIDRETVMKYIVSYGICRVNDVGCDLIVEDAVLLHDLDKEVVKSKIDDCSKELSLVTSAARKNKLEQKLEFLQLCLATDKPGK